VTTWESPSTSTLALKVGEDVKNVKTQVYNPSLFSVLTQEDA